MTAPWPELVGLLMLGLVSGAGHCVGMCSPFVLYVSRRFAPAAEGRWRVLGPQGLYTCGRIATYTALAALAGALGSAVDLLSDLAGMQRGAAALAGLSLVIAGIAQWQGGGAGWFRWGGPRIAAFVQSIQRRAPGNAFLTGVVLGFLPCGLLYAALLSAAAMGSAWQGALGGLLFGVGTVPAMMALAVADVSVLRHWRHGRLLTGTFLLVMGAWFTYQSVTIP